MPVEQQLRDLRRALQRLAAAVMWRDGVPMPQRKHEQVVDASVPMTVHQPGETKHAEFSQISVVVVMQ